MPYDYIEEYQKQNDETIWLFRDKDAQEKIDTSSTETDYANPLSLETMQAQLAENTKIKIEPIQDLHGYDKPWVGGAGKNLLPLIIDDIKSTNSGTWTGNSVVKNNITWTILTDNDENVIGIEADGTAQSDSNFYIQFNSIASGSYYYSGCPNDGLTGAYRNVYCWDHTTNSRCKQWDGTTNVINCETYTDYQQVKVISDNSQGISLRVHNGKTVSHIVFKPMVCTSTATNPAQFEPYENKASISGRSEIGILGEGENLLPMSVSAIKAVNTDGTWSGNSYSYGNMVWTLNTDSNNNVVSINANGTGSANNSHLIISLGNTIQNGNYYFSGCPNINGCNIYCWDKTTSARAKKWDGTTNSENSTSYTDYEQIKVVQTDDMQLRLRVDDTITVTNIKFKPIISALEVSTDLTINLGQTVYGGSLDLEKGILTVDRQIVDLGDLEWILETDATGVYFRTNISDLKPSASSYSYPDAICSHYQGMPSSNVIDKSFAISANMGRVYLRDLDYSDVTSFTNAMDGIDFVYELATPITIQLTPHEISLLKGVNNISILDNNASAKLTYRNGMFATLSDLLDLEKKLTDEEPYGFIEHMSILDPAQRIEYIGKNKNYSPMTINLAGDHLANYNEWYDFPVIKENKPYMIKADGTVDYALDPNDYTKKFDGSASDVANTSYTGGAFAWIPKTYKREFVVGDDRYVYISTKKLSDEYEAIGFIDENGLEHDGAWIPMFYGTEITQDGTVKIMTLATGTPSQSRDTATQKTYIENFSSQAKFFGGPIVNVLADLLIMLGKNSDVQAVFGTGNMSGGNGAQYMKANACIDGGAFYGTTTNNVLNKAFHSLVLLTQNQYQRDPYTLCYKGEFWISPYYKYDLTGDSYVKTGIYVTPPSSNNWVYPNKSVSVPHWGAIPVGPYSGSTTTGWADGQYTRADQLTDATVRVGLRFADCADGRLGGPRCLVLLYGAGSTYWGFGASALLLSEGKSK